MFARFALLMDLLLYILRATLVRADVPATYNRAFVVLSVRRKTFLTQQAPCSANIVSALCEPWLQSRGVVFVHVVFYLTLILAAPQQVCHILPVSCLSCIEPGCGAMGSHLYIILQCST